MDRTRFDELTRMLAQGTSRRTVLRGLIGGTAVYAGLREVTVAQACIAPGQTCEMVDGATPCCDDPCYTCFEGTCDYGGGRGSVDAGCACETDEDCFESLCVESICTVEDACIAAGGACEMVDGATPCCGCYTCFEAICSNPKGCWDADCACETDSECCDDLLCVDGSCGSGDIALPETGSGASDSSPTWVAAAVAGGAAVVAANAIRKSCADRAQ